jgi:restriction system protein
LHRLLDNVRRHGQEEQIINFINRFGTLNRKGNGWPYRNYKFDWYRINDLEKDLIENGVPLNTETGNRDVFTILRHYIQDKEERLTRESIRSQQQQFKNLNGLDFEKLLERLYTAMEYTVQHLGGSGDQGGDLVANKDGERLLIQAKCYQDWKVGNAAVQQVVGAIKYHDCHKTVVVTTSTTFTPAAIALARANSTDHISKERLTEMLLQYQHESWV